MSVATLGSGKKTATTRKITIGCGWECRGDTMNQRGCDGLIDFFGIVGLVGIRGRGVLSGLRMRWAANSFEKRTVTGSAPLAKEGVVVC